MPDGTPNAAQGQQQQQQQAAPTGQGPVQTPQQGAPQGQQQAVPLTPDQVREIARQEALRTSQSQVAKSEQRTDKRIDEKIAERFGSLEQNKAVLGLTDAQVKTAQQNIVLEEYAAAAASAPATTQAQTVQPQASDDLHPLYQIALPIFQREGTEISSADPEFATLDPFLNMANPQPKDLTDYVLAVEKAVATKKERTASQQADADLRVPGGAGAPASGEAQNLPGHRLWEGAFKK